MTYHATPEDAAASAAAAGADHLLYYHIVPPLLFGPMEAIFLSPNADGSIRQFIEESADDGATWTTWFDGRYVGRDVASR